MRKRFSIIFFYLLIVIAGCNERVYDQSRYFSDLSLSTDEVDFGKVHIKREYQREIKLSNRGGIDLTFERAELRLISHSSPDPFRVTIDNKGIDRIREVVIAPKSEKSMIISYKPENLDMDAGELHLFWYRDKAKMERVESVVRLRGEAKESQIDLCILDSLDREVKCRSTCPNDTNCVGLYFGIFEINDEDFIRFAIKNTGAAPLDILDARVVQCPSSRPDCTDVNIMIPTTSENEFFMTDPESGYFRGTLSVYPEEGSTKIVTVRYKAVSMGMVNGALKVQSTDPLFPVIYAWLSGTGKGPKLCVEPEVYSFPTTKVLERSIGRIEIKSCGTKELYLEDIEIINNRENEFYYDRFTLPRVLHPGESVDVNIYYQPISCSDSDSPDIALLKITSDDPYLPDGIKYVKIYGDCQPLSGCNILIEPDKLDFGSISPDSSREESFNIINIGDNTCNIASIGGLRWNVFSITNVVKENSKGEQREISPPYSFYLMPGEKGIVTVRFTGSYYYNCERFEDYITINYDGKNAKVLIEGSMMCIDNWYCNLSVTPSTTLNFGDVAKGSCKTKDILLESKGSFDCFIEEVKFGEKTGPWFSLVKSFDNTRIYSGDFEKIEISCCPSGTGVAPDAMGEPDYNSEYNYIYIKTDAINSPSQCKSEGRGWCINLQCTGIESRLDVLPNPVYFGVIPNGCASQEVVIKLYNNGTTPLKVGPDISVIPSPPFMISSKPEGITQIQPGSSTSIRLKYVPTILQGVETGRLRIQTDAPNAKNGYMEVALKGEVSPDRSVTDRFIYSNIPVVDVLWCVDNSKTMGVKQGILVENAHRFLDYATVKDPLTEDYKVDFHIGVITSEINSPTIIDDVMNYPGVLYAKKGYPKIIANYPPQNQIRDPAFEPVTTDFNKAFEENSSVGTCCSEEQEACLEALRMALSDPITSDPQGNKGFLRNVNTKFSKLAIVIFSDEDDQSPGTVDYYVDFFRQIKGEGNRDLLSVNVIAGLDRDGTVQDPPEAVDCGDIQGENGASAAKRYLEFYKKIGNGRVYSICDGRWGERLGELAVDVWNSTVQYHLSRIPEPDTIYVTVDGKPLSNDPVNGYQYDPIHNSIKFGPNALPPEGAEIEVEYEAKCF